MVEYSDEELELEHEVRERILDRSTVDSNKLSEIIIQIFKRLPKKDVDFLLYERQVYFVLPLCNMAYYFPALVLGKDVEKIERWLILLVSEIINYPKDELIYVITHELAHCYLDHAILGPAEQELDADRQVIKWGFEKELKATPWNYLYGDSDPNKGLKPLKDMYKKKGG